MNRPRVVALLREQARVIIKIADAIEEDDGEETPARKKSRPITDIEKARARKALRRVGLDV